MTTKKDFIEIGEWQLNAFKQRDEYKQALEEIREIAKEIANKQIFKNNVYENLDTKGKRILDKINEVLK